MSTALTLYNSACNALLEARTLLDVKDVANKATALKEYGLLANDRSLEIKAAELRIRSERRLGEMLAQVDLHKGGRPLHKTNSNSELVSAPTLEELEIEPKLSARAQQLAAISEPAIEARIARWRDKAKRGAGRITVNILRDDGERVPKKGAALKASAWASATPEERRHIETVKLSAIVAAVGARAFYRGLTA